MSSRSLSDIPCLKNDPSYENIGAICLRVREIYAENKMAAVKKTRLISPFKVFSSKNSQMNYSFGYHCTSCFNFLHKSQNVKILEYHFLNILYRNQGMFDLSSFSNFYNEENATKMFNT
jgi:hypothetical protein